MSVCCVALHYINRQEMSKIINIRPVKTTIKKPVTPQAKRPTLADAPGEVVDDGRAIQWATTNAGAHITPVELQKVSMETGVQNLNTAKVLQIKSLMRTMTCAQIVVRMKGRKGYSKRTIERYHAALSKAGGGCE
jgi:hypothetical protein